MPRLTFLAVAAMMLWQPASAAEPPPRRVVSFNICADQLVVALADPGQIAGLSPYAADPLLSVVADKAKAFPRLEWQAESTVALKPDLVIVGDTDRPATKRMLTRLGIKSAEIKLVTDIAAARAQIAEVAAWLGHPERGRALVAQLDKAKARLDAVRHAPATALIVERSGFTAGPDSLAARLVAEAGFHPPKNAPTGLGGYLPLEKLLTLRPDVLILKDAPGVAKDQGALYLTHPALKALYPPGRRLILPERYTLCGGPALVAALDYLADALPKLAAKR